MSKALLLPPSDLDVSIKTLDGEIVKVIEEQGVVGLDALIIELSLYSWSRIFDAVDRLARSEKIVLRRHRFDYTLFSRDYAA
jgi:hypothetical protein